MHAETVLERLLPAGLEKYNIPGAVAGVSVGGETYLKAFGLADIENGIPMTEDTALPIGSLTKGFSAAAALLACRDNGLSPETRVRSVLPEFGLYSEEASVEVTIRDLLCHDTGLPRHDLAWLGRPGLSRDALALEVLKLLRPNMPFRGGFQYQNLTYAAVGTLTERLDCMPWEAIVRQRLLEPLGMSDTVFVPPASAAVPYMRGEPPRRAERVDFSSVAPAGAMYSTGRDVLAWLRCLAGGGAPVLDSVAMAELQDVSIPCRFRPFALPDCEPRGYGLGWMLYQFRGELMADHSGNVPGASAYIAVLPRRSVGCFVLTNADATLFGAGVAASVFDALLGIGEERDWAEEYETELEKLRLAAESERAAALDGALQVSTSAEDAESLAGIYGSPAYGELEIRAESTGRLELRLNGNPPSKLLSTDQGYVAEVCGVCAKLEAIPGQNSLRAVSLKLEPKAEPTVFFAKAKKAL